MEVAGQNSCAQGNNFLLNTDEFESDLKARLKWPRDRWISGGESGSRINKLCNSMKFWHPKLKPALINVSLIITVYNPNADKKTDLNVIVNEIEALDKGKELVKGYSEFRNPRYLCLYFESVEIRDFVQKNFRLINDSYVVYLSWASETVGETLKVHWLPMAVDINSIKKQLNSYVKIIEEERLNFGLMSGRRLPSGKVAFKVAFNEGIRAADVPHLIQIEGMEALVTIPGRQPLCLTCEQLGHISKDCQKRFCVKCSSLQFNTHECTRKKRSYAQVLNKNSERLDPDDWGAEIVTEKQKDFNLGKDNIQTQIHTLEKKILEFNQAANIDGTVPKKRRGEDEINVDFTSADKLENETKSDVEQNSSEEEGKSDGDMQETQSVIDPCLGGSNVDQVSVNGLGAQVPTPSELNFEKDLKASKSTVGSVKTYSKKKGYLKNKINKQEASFNMLVEDRGFAFHD